MIASFSALRRSLLLLPALLLPLAVAAANLQVVIDGETVTLEDVPDNAWYTPFVRKGVEAGIASGYRDGSGALLGTFGPNDYVTVGQAFKMVVNAAEYNVDAFFEGEMTHWADPFAAVAAAWDSYVVQNGYELDAYATRGQVAQLITESFGLFVFDVTFPEEYVDVPVDHPYATGIESMLAGEIMVGDNRIQRCPQAEGCEKTTFRPNDLISRAEILKAVVIAREKYGTFGHGVNLQTITREPDVYTPPVLTYGDRGFFPFTLNILEGTTVQVLNLSSRDLKLESEPTYFVYPPIEETTVITPGNLLNVVFEEGDLDIFIRNQVNPFDRALILIRGAK